MENYTELKLSNNPAFGTFVRTRQSYRILGLQGPKLGPTLRATPSSFKVSTTRLLRCSSQDPAMKTRKLAELENAQGRQCHFIKP